MPDSHSNPAKIAAQAAIDEVFACIDARRNFILEAGAGAGKTYSLIKALEYIIEKEGDKLPRKHQQVACITYTNVAKDEIELRTDRHPAIYPSTIHSFCWSQIKDFQPFLRSVLPQIGKWSEKLEDSCGITDQRVHYDEFGHRSVDEAVISLHHDDVILLTSMLMDKPKFKRRLAERYPIIFIDEYQDTDKGFADTLISHFIETKDGPLIGFFGDHWQKIYGDGCGKIECRDLEIIRQESNFRSAPIIIHCLNRMRTELPQHESDPDAEGSVLVLHTNEWRGARRTGGHWADDLPPDAARTHLEALTVHLKVNDWDFLLEHTKILILTHTVLANDQGYGSIAKLFKYNDAFIKKDDSYIKFFAEVLEPACNAYQNKRFGEMFAALGSRAQNMKTHADKRTWITDMDAVISLRENSSIGEVLDHIRQTKRPRLPESVESREIAFEHFTPGTDEENDSIKLSHDLRQVPYKEIIALTQFIEGHTPFATKHGVKGAEFENVLAVFGRGWNIYNFNRFLEMASNPRSVRADKLDEYERNRNLFYVVCSRPKTRLALLFTQNLSDTALATLSNWFGADAIRSYYEIIEHPRS